MPEKIHWTPPADALLRRLRTEGATWEAIAVILRIGCSTVIARGYRLGLRRPSPDAVCAARRMLLDLAREPLPAGHPISWRAITADTLLAGSDYPLPVWHDWNGG